MPGLQAKPTVSSLAYGPFVRVHALSLSPGDSLKVKCETWRQNNTSRQTIQKAHVT
jgi:hypothetical protein